MFKTVFCLHIEKINNCLQFIYTLNSYIYKIYDTCQWRIQDLALRGVDFVNGGGGLKSVEGWSKSHYSVFLVILLLKLCLHLIASEEKIERKIAFGA